MSEELRHESLLWDDDDQSWAFPNLGFHGGDDDCGKKLAADTTNPDVQAAARPDEGAAPPPAAKLAKKRGGGGEEGKGGGGGGGGGEQSEEHELHIWTERERRKKMRNMFSNLHALLPHLPPKADKSTIVDEAVNYIKKLQETLEKLQKQKLDKLHNTNNHVITRINPIVNYDPSSLITQQNFGIIHQSREAFLADMGPTSSTSAVTLASPPNNQLFSGPELSAIFKTWTSANVVLNVCWKDAHFSVCGSKKPGLFTAICFVMEKHKLDVVSAQVSSDRNRCMYMIHARANGGSDQFQQAFSVEEIYKQAAAEIMLWVNS